MPDQQPDVLRERVQRLVTQALQRSEPSAWFDALYAEAQGNPNEIPWAKLAPHPYLQDWLAHRSPQGQGRSAIVIGCGLGDDAEGLAQYGYQVTAFDISPTAIEWCQRRFPDSPVTYTVANLLHLPSDWQQQFDLVMECRNIQALPLNVRSQSIQAVSSLVAPGGTLLLITRVRETEAEPDGPPWALSDGELSQFESLGFQRVDRTPFVDSNGIHHLRLEYTNPTPL